MWMIKGMRVTDIIAKTMEILGEVNPMDESELTNNSLPLEALVVSYIEKSVEDIFLQAPVYVLPWDEMAGDVVSYGDGSGYWVLPDDCMGRFVIRMHGWRRDVTRVIAADDALYALQRDAVTRGGVERPVCVLTADDGGRPILEYYSLPAYIRNPVADKKLYVKRVAIPRQGEAYGDMEIGGSPRLLVPVAMRCACYVSAALGNVPLSKYLEEETGKQMLRL